MRYMRYIHILLIITMLLLIMFYINKLLIKYRFIYEIKGHNYQKD